MEFSTITKHPIRDCFVLYCKAFPKIEPILGSFEECIKAQEYMEIKAQEIYNNLPITDKEWAVKQIK